MNSYLLYALRGEKMCFVHVLLNALDLHSKGKEVQVVFEGQAVLLPQVFEEEKNALYLKAKNAGLIAGICKACSKQLGVLEYNETLDLPLLDDMNGHAGVAPFLEKGYTVLTF